MIVDSEYGVLHNNNNVYDGNANATIATDNAVYWPSYNANLTTFSNAEPGAGGQLRVKAVMTENAANGTSVQFVLQTSPDNAGGNYATIYEGPVVAVANAVVGKVLYDAPLPASGLDNYVRGAFVCLGNAVDGGKATAVIVPG